MRLERIGLRDRDGDRHWTTETLDGRVIAWWHPSPTRRDEFGSWFGGLGQSRSRSIDPLDEALDGVPVGRIEARLKQDGRTRVASRSHDRLGWWFDDAAAPQRIGDELSAYLRPDQPDSVHESWIAPLAHELAGSSTTVVDERGTSIGRADYERWLDDASRLRRHLDELIAERDRLRARWESERDADRERIAALRSELAATEREIADSEARLSSLRLEIDGVERREGALRAELRGLPETIERRIVTPNPLLARLERIDRRLLSWRKAQQRIERGIDRARAELTDIAIAADGAAEAAFQRIRRGLFDFEASAESILRLAHRLELQWPAGSERRMPAEGELKATCESLYDELHRLHERLAQRHAALARRDILLRLRHLRRLQRDIARHLNALLAGRERTVEELSRSGVSAELLGLRAQQGFCRCAREDGYVGTCTAELAGSCATSVVERIPSARRAEVVEALRIEAERLRSLRGRLAADEPTRRELERRREGLERQLRDLENGDRPTEATRALERLREEIDRGEEHYRSLLTQIARYERGRAVRRTDRLERAAKWVARVTCGRWTSVAADAAGTRLIVADASGTWHDWSSLAIEGRRGVALGLCLAWNAERGADGIWPTVIALPSLPDAWQIAADDAVRDSATIGAPIWLLGLDHDRLRSWRSVDAIRVLPEWSAELPPRIIEPIRRPEPIPLPRAVEQRVVVHRTNNTDAEEFPGEFRDQLMARRPVAENATWTTESQIEAYSTGDRLDRIDDPEAWIGQWLEEDDLDGERPSASSSDAFGLWSGRSLDTGELVSVALRRWLASQSITTWGELARADRNRLVEGQPLVAWTDRIAPWHATAMLLCDGVVDRPFDALILAHCGIDSMNALRATRPFDLLQRIRALRETEDGRRLLAGGTDDELSRLCAWVKTLELARPLHEFGYRDVEIDHEGPSDRSPRDGDRRERRDERDDRQERAERPSTSDARSRSDRAERESRSETESRGDRPTRSERSSGAERPEVTEREARRERRRRERDANGESSESESRSERKATVRFDRRHADPSSRSASIATRTDRSERMRFFLEVDQDIESAPSIGPRSAERFREIGVRTVGQLLKGDADEIAERLGLSRVDGDTVLAWQQQTELVCRVPNLRGHDAQLLVACGIETAEQLAAADVDRLLGKVRPFALGSEGQRLLRKAPVPDRNEVSDWIRWAQNTRALRVA